VETAGAGNEEARELLVLKVCLNEIKRSRPFLLVLLGDRYGWVPPEDRMAAAAQEAGLAGQVQGRSVTALEIEYGILKESPEQRRRCFSYLRDPLPYDRMPAELAQRYSDAHGTDPGAPARAAALEALKARLDRDPELGSRVRHYRAGWDQTGQRVTGLEAWGEQVFQDLWGDLESETRQFAQQPLPTWEQAERAALAEFVEHRTRDFVGREDLTGQLLGIAHSPVQDGAPWCACVTGSAGSGKSAVFAHLYRRLESDRSVLLLAHAAGISLRASQVDAMLRRWIGELAASLGVTDPLPDKASNEEVEQTFASLLGRSAQRSRVVVLVDALNQFEPTPRAGHLTWLPKLWPPNARLIATGLPGPQTQALGQRSGVLGIGLAPLTARDAEEISRKVWARYHRQLNPQVLRTLQDKRRPDGTSSCGNPLWLNLANEQLNLLDADDFERAERQFSGSPAEQLGRMMVDMAERLPPDVEGLYDWLFAHAEKVHGGPWVKAFSGLIAASRFGWREGDLRVLVPVAAGLFAPGISTETWDDLRLAALRRAFRAHLVERGAAGQWDFFHAQARTTLTRRNLADSRLLQRLHSAIADHLQGLPREDPLHESETMHHLREADDRVRAARHYGGDLTAGQAQGVTSVLAARCLEGEAYPENPEVMWVRSLPDAVRENRSVAAGLCNRFLYDLNGAILNQARLATRSALHTATRAGLERLVSSDPTNADWQRGLSVSQERIGDVLLAQGDLAGAMQAYRQALEVAQRPASADPTNALWLHDLSASHDRIGGVLLAQGDLASALKAYSESLAISRPLASADPTNAEWQRDLSVSHGKIGDVLLAQRDLAGAMQAYRQSLEVAQRLASADPANAQWQRDLWVSYWRMAAIAEKTGTGDAMGWWHKALEKMADMKQRGILLPTDEPFLRQLQQKVRG